MFRTIVEAVFHHGEHTPDKLAVGFKNTRLSYRELCVEIQRAAGILKNEYQVKAGDKVMLSGVSKPEYAVLYLAIQYIGAVSVPIDKSAKESNLLSVCEFFRPKLVLTDSKISDENVPKESLKAFYVKVTETDAECGEVSEYNFRDEDEVAEILFTTGTTGAPKGAMLTYRNIYASMHNTWEGVGMLPEDCVLIPLPLNHSIGMRVFRTALYIGASVVLQNGFTFAKELEANIDRFGCTAMVSVPASMELVQRQMQEHFAEILGRLRYIEVGAGSLSFGMKKKLPEILPDTIIYNTWGSTETGGVLFLNISERRDKLTSIGTPVSNARLKVVNAEGQEVQAHNVDSAGRMALQGDMQMAGYYQMPEISAEALVDGWLYTNDLVYTDHDGYVYMLGRADDIINVGGEKVSPLEVENIAGEFEQIRECACIGVEDPDGVLGQIPVLYVVTEGSEFDQNALMKFLAGKMEKYKFPQKFITIDELPRNRMKKLDRRALKEMWTETGDVEVSNPVIRNIMSRQSVREFTEQEIQKAYLEAIVKAGIQAPSGHNMQTWKFTVLRNTEKIRELKETILKVCKEKGVHCYGFENPKVLILVSNDRRNENGIQDSACAAENMMLAAASYGIGSVWLNPLRTICDEPEVREMLAEFEIPANHLVWSMVALGYAKKALVSPKRKMNVIKWID